jgi:Domain of unknown function (DUF4167)
VRQGQQNRRGRGRNNNRKNHNPLARSFESNGPDVKIRGTPAHIAEKYLSLARDAQSSGDPVLAENYLQHAEHYTRIIMAYREQLSQPVDMVNGNGQRMRGSSESGDVGDEFGDDDGEEGLDDGFPPSLPQQHQPPPRQHGGYEAGNRHEGGGRHDRPFRRDHGRFRDRDRHQDRDRDRQGENRQSENRPPVPDRQQEPAETAGAEPQQRRRERFSQQPHEQPEFLRRPVRRARSEGEETASPGKEEPPRD